ncbi:MAG TPA: lytic transglycosylase domain-containing protein [Mycobacteriales bacterium]|nr:lytic transglycosylase domain-containing protein [Mycobacteriales bacterium]
MLRPRRALLPVAGLAAAALVMIAGAVGVAHALAPDDRAAATGGLANATSAQPSSTDRSVAPLRRITPPDAVALLAKSATPRQLRRVWKLSGVRAVAVLDTGRITVRGHHLHAVGVRAGRIRTFTPALTAKSDPLWQSIAQGDLTVGYAAARSLRHRLGQTLMVRGPRHHLATTRIGAFASLGLGSAQGVLSHHRAMQLGLHPSRRLYVSAPHVAVSTLAVDLRRIFGAHVVVRDVRPHVTVQPISAFAQSTIPAPYLALYRSAAATCPGLPWTVLAGIGAVETGHGANVHRSVKGAVGPMQFLPSTFAAYGVDGNGDGVADIHNPADAIYSAARYLCLWGAGRGGQALYDAIWAYNHADWYVRLVVNYANAYA